MFNDSSEVLKFIKDEDVKFLDIRFTDLPGVQQHFNIPASTVDEEFFTVGQLFDGSSIRGFANIHESDMQLIPDVSTAYVDQFREAKTLDHDLRHLQPAQRRDLPQGPASGRQEGREVPRLDRHRRHRVLRPRGRVLHLRRRPLRGEAELELLGVDSEEGAWNTGRVEEGGNLANKTPYKGGYFPVSPVDKTADLRDDISLKLIEAGLILERCHHEVGTGGQARDQLPLRHDGARGGRHPEVQVHRQEHRGAVGQDRHVHAEAPVRRQRLGHAHAPVAVERRQAAVLRRERLRRPVRHRPLVHRRPAGARARACSPSPTRRSTVPRLVPGFEAPVNLVYSAGNRSAAIRIPITGTNPKAKRIEFRAPDASGNPYLAFAAQLMAGLEAASSCAANAR